MTQLVGHLLNKPVNLADIKEEVKYPREEYTLFNTPKAQLGAGTAFWQ